jgi:tetratricopeptide (TPR) repeat protein
VAQLTEALRLATGDAETAVLQQLEAIYALDPALSIEHLSTVHRLVELCPRDSTLASRFVELLDVVAGLVISPSRDERLASALEAIARLLGERGAMAKARFHLRHGQLETALEALRPLLAEPNTTIRGLLWVFALARRCRDQSLSARAAERVAPSFRPAVRSVIEALAAQLYLDAGEYGEAERLVYGALRTNQNTARLATLQVILAEYREPPTSLDSLERALSKVMPTAAMCRSLAISHRLAGELDLAFVWAQRAVSLRPGDLELRRELFALALGLGDAGRVAELLNDLRNVPLPVSGWDEVAASALAWLASVDATRAIGLSRQLLDIAGPSSRSLRAAMLDTARLASDEDFALEILERAAASMPATQERAELELAAAERHWKRGDTESCLRAAFCAMNDGAAPDVWMGYAQSEGERASGDALLLRLELLRRLALNNPETDQSQQASSALAVARFDLGQDTDGAVALWTEMAQGPTRCAVASVAREMASVLGHRVAVAELEVMARSGASALVRGQLLVHAALLSEESGETQRAVELLEAATQYVPSCVFALRMAERLLAHDLPRLDALYGRVEAGVLGVFGARALHFRLALFLTMKGELALALPHATAAFEALPDYATSFQLLIELSRRTHDPNVLANAVMRVAEAQSDRAHSAYWLARGYEALGDDVESLRLKFDFAVRIVVGTPGVKAVEAVSHCLHELQALGVEELDFLRLRFVRALESLSGELEGPDGARLGIAIVQVATTILRHPELANGALLGALKADADIDEFESLRTILPLLSELDRSGLKVALGKALDWLDRPYVAIGQPAVEQLATIAVLVSDAEALMRLSQRTLQLGRAPWLSRFITDADPTVWSKLEDVRGLAVDIARRGLDQGEVHVAMAVLELAARIAGRAEQNAEGAASDAAWQSWQLSYGICLLRTLHEAGLHETRQRLSELESFVPAMTLSGLRVAIERQSGDEHALSGALAEMAFTGVGTARSRAALLVEAAQIAERLGELDGAIVYYRAGVGTSRSYAPARLGLATLLYRVGRYRAREQAELALDVMTGLDGVVAEEDRDLVAFLVAEALIAGGQFAQARHVLTQAESQLGPRTFVVLGLAEQACRDEDFAAALGYYAAALGGGLRGIRSKSEVALAAARAAAAIGDVPLALGWLEPCLGEALTRPEALTLQAELLGASEASEADSAAFAAESDESLALRQPADERTSTATAVSEPPPSSREHESPVVSRPEDSSASFPQPPLPELSRPEASWVSQPGPESSELVDDTFAVDPSAVDDSRPGWSPPSASSAGPSASELSELSQGSGREALDLSGEMAPPPSSRSGATARIPDPGAYEFALAVAEDLRSDPERQRAWLADGRRWLRQWPTQLRLMELVRDAAEAEGHSSHVRALQQVIGLLCGDEVLEQPPELGEQEVDVDAVRSLLLRDLMTPGAEALELVWDGAEHEFQREPSEYELTGLMRVVGAASPMSRVYAEAARHFGMTRTPLFHRRTQEETRISILLLAPTAVLAEGEPPQDEQVTGYRLGSALWATLPAFSLLFGLGEEHVRQVLKALSLAFGTGGGQPNRTYGESLRLAQVFWQTVKSRSQRRLKEICRAELVYEQSYQQASQSLRRAGLYVCGDLRTAVASWCADAGVEDVTRAPSRLLELATTSSDVFDLFRFATSAEYAAVRWQPGRPNQPGGGTRPW